MLIEIYEDNDSGSIVFSKNKYDFLTNFVIVDKLKPEVTKFLDYKEISSILNKPVKKNLILYRLLTNDEELDPFSSKVGFFLKLQDKIEIVYFDPIFVLKDLEHLKITIPKEEFRFKIQQVGYKTKSIVDEVVIFEENFCIDLSDEEAKNQNDSIFAETMLSLNIINENLVESKQDLFKNIHSEVSKDESKFYNLEKSESRESEFKNKIKTNIKEGKSDHDFFSRVNQKKHNRENDKASTLKMFR